MAIDLHGREHSETTGKFVAKGQAGPETPKDSEKALRAVLNQRAPAGGIGGDEQAEGEEKSHSPEADYEFHGRLVFVIPMRYRASFRKDAIDLVEKYGGRIV